MRTRVEMKVYELCDLIHSNNADDLYITEDYHTPISESPQHHLDGFYRSMPSGLVLVLWREETNTEEVDARLSCRRITASGEPIREVHTYYDRVNVETDYGTRRFVPGETIKVRVRVES